MIVLLMSDGCCPEEGRQMSKADFTVDTITGHAYLRFRGKGVGSYHVSENWQEKYPTIEDWIAFVVKRTVKRQEKINEQIETLREESRYLDSLIDAGK